MTRFLVPPLREKFGELRGCTGATMEDGTRYFAGRAGAFEVDRPDHARAIRNDPNIAGDIVAETFHAQDARPGWRCSCSVTELWAFTKVCPRCGAPRPEEVASEP